MSLGRHNNGQFQEKHEDGTPVIHDYDDVYSFLVESPEQCKTKDAVALHLFGLALGQMIDDEEKRIGHKLTNDEITNIIRHRVGARPGQILYTILAKAHKKTVDDYERANDELLTKIVEKSKPRVRRIVRDGLIASWSMVASVILLFAAVAIVDRGFMSHDLWGEALTFFRLRTSASAASADAKIDDLRQQVADLKKSPAPVSAVDAKIDGLKSSIDDLRQQMANPQKPPSAPKPTKPTTHHKGPK